MTTMRFGATPSSPPTIHSQLSPSYLMQDNSNINAILGDTSTSTTTSTVSTSFISNLPFPPALFLSPSRSEHLQQLQNQNHHHFRHHHNIIQFGDRGGKTVNRKLINTAASMAAGVIESVTSSSPPSIAPSSSSTLAPSPSSYFQQQYYQEEPSASGFFPGVPSSANSDQMNESAGTIMNDTLNSSMLNQPFPEWPVRDPLGIVIPITVIYVIILLIGLLGNVVTCIVIVRSRYLHTTTNYYLFSLAISDLLLLLSGLPVEMYSIWKRYPYIFGEYFCIGRGLAAETSSNATVLTITAFTIERYLAICRPFMIQKWQNKLSRVVRQILIIWVISISLAVPQVGNNIMFSIINNALSRSLCYDCKIVICYY